VKKTFLLGLAVVGFLVVCDAAFAQQAQQREVLVLANTSVNMAATPITNRKAIEIQNQGPNSIFCSINYFGGGDGGITVGKAREIASGGAWALDIGPTVKVWCRAETADQVTGAATIVTEIR
jgi:hypothetical protein